MTVAELKRAAKAGTLEGRIVFHSMWQEGIPERLQVWRKIVGSNSVSLFFKTKGGNVSELQIPRASLVEYDGKSLTIYNAGYRDLNAAEQKVMDGWKKIKSTPDFKERAYNDAYTDGSSTYWSEVYYFRNAGMEYLMGLEKQRGLKYDFNSQKIQDDSIKGSVCIKYEIREVERKYA